MAQSAAKEFVDNQIQSNKIVVFSKSYCPYCTTAKQTLNEYVIIFSMSYCDVYGSYFSVRVKAKYIVVELDGRSDCSAIQDYLLKLTGERTVSIVIY